MHHVFITTLLLGTAVAVALVCAVAIVVMRDAYQRLHCAAPITTISVFLIVLAVWLEDPDWQARIKATLVALILFAMNGVLSHATARAIRIRDRGHWPVEPGDEISVARDDGTETAE